MPEHIGAHGVQRWVLLSQLPRESLDIRFLVLLPGSTEVVDLRVEASSLYREMRVDIDSSHTAEEVQQKLWTAAAAGSLLMLACVRPTTNSEGLQQCVARRDKIRTLLDAFEFSIVTKI